MSGVLGALGLLVAAWAIFAAATSVGVAVAWRLGARRLRRLHPAVRSRLAWAAAAAPSLVPTLLVAACLAPGVVGLLSGAGDHCLQHADHPHLCLVHLPATLRTPLLVVVAVGATGLALALGAAAAQVARQRRQLARLAVAASPASDPRRRVVPSERPFSFVAGLVRPEIWIASTLEEALPAAQLAVVLAHERAHLERHDPLRAVTAALLSWPHWPGVRRAILAELALASEQACDESAAARLGDRLRVAETLLAVERLLGARAPVASPGSAFGGSNVAARVRGLVGEPAPARLPGWVAWAAAILFAAALPAGSDALHHWTEHGIGLLLGAG
ncbi:MAG: M56 family metallopeptidase [Myxococcota bacterium]